MLLDFSVLMSVYAKEKPDFLNQSLESIWDAQRLKPTQIVLVKNGPLPIGLEDIVSSWSYKLGSVLKIVNLELNAGLAPALNHGLMHCDHDYVARMDSDDISLPDRFYLQIQFIIKNPDVDCFGSWVAEYDESLTKLIKYRKVPLKHNEIVKFCRRRNPLSHPSVFFRKEAVFAVGCYDEFSPEDYFLWFKLLDAGFKLANLPDLLVNMRAGKGFSNRRGLDFLKGEFKIYTSMYSSGFISLFRLVTNIVSRSVLRLSPPLFKRLLYKYFRA